MWYVVFNEDGFVVTYLYPAQSEDETDACTNWTFITDITDNTTSDLLTVNSYGEIILGRTQYQIYNQNLLLI